MKTEFGKGSADISFQAIPSRLLQSPYYKKTLCGVSPDKTRVASGMVQLESIERKNDRPMRVLELPASRPLHLEHAYASTIHSAQGLTNDRALIAIDTKSRTTSMNLYYVAISRARHEARVYTDSVKNLPTAIGRHFTKTTALAVQRGRELQRKGIAVEKPSLQHRKMEQQRKTPHEYGRFG